MNVKRGWSGFPVRRAVSESLDLDLAFSLLLGHPDDSGCVLFCSFSLFIVCPIATAWDRLYTRFASVSVSVHLCAHTWSHFLIYFTKIGADVKTPKSENEFDESQHRSILSPILPPKTPILGQEILKTHANIFALNVRESPKFLRLEEFGVRKQDGDVRY